MTRVQQLRVSTTSKPNLEGRVGRSRPSRAPCPSKQGSRFPAISSWRCSSARLGARRRPSDVRSYVLFTCFVCRSTTARGVFGGRSRPSTSVGLLLVRAMASLEERCDARLSFRRMFRVRSRRLEDLLPPLVHQASRSACHVRVGMVAKPLHVGGDHGLFQRALAEDEGGKVPQRFQQLLFAARFAFQHLLAPPHLFFAVTECAFSAQDHHVLQIHEPRHPSVSHGRFASIATSVAASTPTLHSAIFFCFGCPSSRSSCGSSCRVTYRSIRTTCATSMDGWHVSRAATDLCHRRREGRDTEGGCNEGRRRLQELDVIGSGCTQITQHGDLG